MKIKFKVGVGKFHLACKVYYMLSRVSSINNEIIFEVGEGVDSDTLAEIIEIFEDGGINYNIDKKLGEE